MTETVRNFEELLIGRLNMMLAALDAENFDLFDHIMENTEILLKIKKGLYDIYMKWKVFYGSQLQLAYREIEVRSAGIDDPYTKRMHKDRNDAIAEWGYRLDLLQKLISLLNDYNLVPFATPEYAEVQTDQSIPEQPPGEIAIEQQQVQPPQKTPQELLDEDMERLQREEAEILSQQRQAIPQTTQMTRLRQENADVLNQQRQQIPQTFQQPAPQTFQQQAPEKKVRFAPKKIQ